MNILRMGERTWQVSVNSRAVAPVYKSEASAMSRAAREAKTHRYVTVTLHVGTRRPRVIATWTDGERN